MIEELTKALDCAVFAAEDTARAYEHAVDTGDSFAAEYLLIVLGKARAVVSLLRTALRAAEHV